MNTYSGKNLKKNTRKSHFFAEVKVIRGHLSGNLK